MAKGGSYEREVCKLLSDWWEPGRDDIFWRSSNSGGRATMRRRRGKSTFGHCGDIAATDPIGQPLIRWAAIECKRGYNRYSPMDALDRLANTLPMQWEEFITQAKEAATNAQAVTWLLIYRRDKRRAMVFLERQTLKSLRELGAFETLPGMFSQFQFKHEGASLTVCAMRLDSFLAEVKPEHIKKLAGT